MTIWDLVNRKCKVALHKGPQSVILLEIEKHLIEWFIYIFQIAFDREKHHILDKVAERVCKLHIDMQFANGL